MPIIRKAALVCDRCGAKQEFDPEVKDPLSMSIMCRTPALAGWAAAGGGRCLCPDCSALHNEIEERHKAEMREFMGDRAVDFGI